MRRYIHFNEKTGPQMKEIINGFMSYMMSYASTSSQVAIDEIWTTERKTYNNLICQLAFSAPHYPKYIDVYVEGGTDSWDVRESTAKPWCISLELVRRSYDLDLELFHLLDGFVLAAAECWNGKIGLFNTPPGTSGDLRYPRENMDGECTCFLSPPCSWCMEAHEDEVDQDLNKLYAEHNEKVARLIEIGQISCGHV